MAMFGDFLKGTLVGGVVGGVGNMLLGGGNRAIDKSTKAQLEAAKTADATTRYMYDTSRADMAPWRTAGAGALDTMTALNNGDFSKFKASPDYQFRLSEGLKAVSGGMNRTHGRNSGAVYKALSDYAGNVASGEYNNFYNRLAGLSGTGQNTATNMGNTAMQAGNTLANSQLHQGDVRASSYIDQQNNLMGLVNMGAQLGGRFMGGM